MMSMSSARVPSIDAAICLCAVVIPLPISVEPHRQMVGAVRQQPHLRARAMLGRRPTFQHGQRDTLALGPFGAFGLGDAIALLQLPLDDIEAFVDAVAAE